jgi:hypothetical protein
MMESQIQYLTISKEKNAQSSLEFDCVIYIWEYNVNQQGAK